MKKLKKIYVEITNVCNLNCEFCHGTKREKRFMTTEEFSAAAKKLRPYSDYIYLHLMGEPLLHPRLAELLRICAELDYRVTVTTNGVLLPEKAALLKGIYRVCVSLHSFEANSFGTDPGEYTEKIALAAKTLSQSGTICSLRLWNGSGRDTLNGEIVSRLSSVFGTEGEQTPKGIKLAGRVYLEYGEKFDWPDKQAEEKLPRFCMALRDQLGILCDGTAVPCCLDADGEIKLGNIFTDTPEDILGCETAKKLYDGFSRGHAVPELCRRCGFAAARFGSVKTE